MSGKQQKKRTDKGVFVVLSSPSGGGKSTVIGALLKRNANFTHSISATTRAPRPGETNGKPYWFISLDEFRQRCENGDFLEWEKVYDDYYGTPKCPAEDAIANGHIVLFDLDVKGALKLKSSRPETLLIFLMPPSLETLEKRLRERATEAEDELQKRLAIARWECDQAAHFDHVVINRELEKTIPDVEQVIYQYIKEKRN